MKTVQECLSSPRELFYRDREFILQRILNRTRSEIYTLKRNLTDLELKKYSLLCRKSKQGYPLAYLLRETEFYGHKFFVEPQVFIPRMDTETLVDSVIRFHSDLLEKSFSFMDWGCGSGCIGLSLLLHFKKARLFSIDLNSRALFVTQKNAQNLGVKKRVCCIQSSVDDLDVQKFPPIAFIVANPPYVDREDSELNPSVLEYEPSSALFSKNKGRDHIERWIHKVRDFFEFHKEMQSYFFEIGYDQHKYVSHLLKNDSIRYIRDFQEIKRVVYLKRGKE